VKFEFLVLLIDVICFQTKKRRRGQAKQSAADAIAAATSNQSGDSESSYQPDQVRIAALKSS